MILHSKKYNTVYFSKGKVGSSTLARALEQTVDSDWVDSAGMYSLTTFITKFKGYKLYVLIREPKKRWLSGFRENSTGPHLYGAELIRVLDTSDKNIEFNLMEFGEPGVILSHHNHYPTPDQKLEIPIYINPKYEQTLKFWRNMVNYLLEYSNLDFAMGENIHTCNWLWQVLILAQHFEVNIVQGNVLDHFSETYGFDANATNKNVSDSLAIEQISRALQILKTGAITYQNLLNHYLKPEIFLFNKINSLKSNDEKLIITEDEINDLFIEYISNIHPSLLKRYAVVNSLYKQNIYMTLLEVASRYKLPSKIQQWMDEFKDNQ